MAARGEGGFRAASREEGKTRGKGETVGQLGTIALQADNTQGEGGREMEQRREQE